MRIQEVTVERGGSAPRDLFSDLERRAASSPGRKGLTLRAFVELAEAWRITEALRECRGNRTAAARALGIGRRTLYTKMERLGVGATWVLRESEAPGATAAE
jgi:DNA-binding NtrC family response regulator